MRPVTAAGLTAKASVTQSVIDGMRNPGADRGYDQRFADILIFDILSAGG
jgi:hypothetical protein